MQSVGLDRPNLPILFAGEAIVVGGSLAGVAAALELARAGQRVLLVEGRTYLGREITATLRPWLPLPPTDGVSVWPDLISACLDGAAFSIETSLKLDHVKRCLEDLLLAAGVKLLYASLPVQVLSQAGAIDGLVLGNKSGRQAVLAEQILDATETALVARLAGVEFETRPPGARRFVRSLEFDAVQPRPEARLAVPEELQVAENIVMLHPGYRGEAHWLIEFAMDLDGEDGLLACMRREVEARRRSLRLASHLIKRAPAFRDAYWSAASHELHGAQVNRMAGAPPAWAGDYGSIAWPMSTAGASSGVEVPVNSFAGPLRGLWCLQEAARLGPEQRDRMADPILACQLGTAFGAALLQHSTPKIAVRATGASRVSASVPERAQPRFEAREPESPQRGRTYPQQAVPPCEAPVLHSCDVLVVGGGTSGASAAIAAASEGVRTVVLEMNPGLGGTGTLGGVHSYWFGRRVGFAGRVRQWVEAAHAALGLPAGRERWNIEAKMQALLEEADRAGVSVLFNALTFAAVVESNRVRGALAATRYGPVAALADAVIDATGDGDLAAFAGAPFVYGAGRDHTVMWYSLAQFVKPGWTQNNFTSMVDVGNVEDYTRAILAGRRRGGEIHEHGAYLATRESRHVLGDVVLDLTDQLRHRRWPDVVNVHFSNHDVKGQTTADWVRLGLIPPNLEVQVPYRALLPRGLEGLWVVGKAISATHDALPAIRMQADMENLGGAAGLAAALAVRQGCGAREIDLAALQRQLVEVGALPAEALNPATEARAYSDDELDRMVAQLDAERPLHAYSDMTMEAVWRDPIPLVEICSAGERAVPILERALSTARGASRLRLAQALAMLRAPAAVPVLIEAIDRELQGDGLPERSAHIRHAGHPPDQGAMPDPAYLLYALGMVPDRRSMPIWQRVVDRLEATPDSLRHPTKGDFYYVDAVCFGAERLGDPETVPILEQLHRHQALHGQVTPAGLQSDFFQERQAMLELAIGRALLRCGSPAGAAILIDYLADGRALLAEAAHSELSAVTRQDFGKEGAAWTVWVAGEAGRLPPRPYVDRRG